MFAERVCVCVGFHWKMKIKKLPEAISTQKNQMENQRRLDIVIHLSYLYFRALIVLMTLLTSPNCRQSQDCIRSRLNLIVEKDIFIAQWIFKMP